ncbi:hypothetical protein [uncultured Roseobacter sp.]|uniref:hypothetical protein n=1 Tax=uncultured Roseobacter sp. TaxID=114847 RepID=UPI0026310C40|nr:hypothetical protein [uncultured Roseobacter sp.]
MTFARLVLTAISVVAVSAFTALADAPSPDSTELSHGGGCRKSSPPGQCCHGGSQPYHCH